MSSSSGKTNNGRPQVIIVEQPSSKGLRFRYECEKKYAASIVGVKSKEHAKTFPTIKILNCKGPVYIVVSCVTKDPPHRPHPHNLIGKIKEVANGICYFKFENTELALGFDNLSIQCVKKKDIEKSLALRQKMRVDPFNTGFDHASDPDSVDPYSLRLCFQVFLEGSTPGVFNVPLRPIVTDPIYDRRSKSEPEITYLSHDEASVTGGTEMCILCERADKDDISVVFYREENDWEEIASFTPPSVYKRVSIVIKTPRYVNQDITEPVEVKVLLRRRSTGDVSDSFPFTYLPLKSHEINPLKRKREEDTCTYHRLREQVENNKYEPYIPKNIDSRNTWKLPAQIIIKDRELESITDLSTNAFEYNSDPLGSSSNSSHPLSKNCVNNFHAKNDEKRKSSISQPSNVEAPPATENANGTNDEAKQSSYSNTLNSDDWIHELLQTIEEDLIHKNNEPEIVQEPEIKYILPDPIPSVANPVPEVQRNFLPEHFAMDMSSLANIPELQEPSPVISHSHLMHGQHPQYAVNVIGNQWNNDLNNATNRQQPLLVTSNYQYIPEHPVNYSQKSVDNNFNGQSNCMMSNGSYGTQMQPFTQQNTWNQVQRATLNEFDPLCPTQNWHTPQEYNRYTQ